MRSKKNIILSLTGGIYLSLVLFISVNFSPLVSEMPLATVDAKPQNVAAVLLDHMRVAFDAGYGMEQSLLAILLAVFLYHVLDKLRQSVYIHRISLIGLSIVFGCINVAGLCMYWLDALPMFTSGIWLAGCIILALGWAMVFLIISCLLFEVFDKGELFSVEAENKTNGNAFEKWVDTHLLLASFLLILMAWLPWIISYYPASMDNDVFMQLQSWFEKPRNHHPWFSTTVLVTFFKMGDAVGNQNLGIFIYVFLRDIILAFIYAKCVCMQKEYGYKKHIYYITLLFFAFTPVWGAYAKHAFKDTFATGLFCFYVVTICMVLDRIKSNQLTWKLCLMHGLAALFASLYRNNCIYAIFPATVLLVFALLNKKQPLRYVLTIILCLSAYFGYNYCIFNYFGVEKGSKAEMMAIPFQQTARTVKFHGSELTEEEIYGLEGIFRYENMPKLYDPIISDPIKSGECLISSKDCRAGGVRDYILTWIKMFPRYPVTYIEAAVGQSYGYYSFTPNLPEQAGNWNSGMAIFDWIGCNGDFDEKFDFHYVNSLDDVRQVLHAWAKVWNKIPLLCLTDMCAFYTWSIILLFYYLFIKKHYINLIPIVAVGVMILTCVASPVNDCFRYYAPVAASFPVLFILLPNNKTIKVDKSVD